MARDSLAIWLTNRLAIWLLATASLACSSEQRTCPIETRDLVMWATVTDLNGSVEVEIELETFAGDDQGTSLELCPNRDELLVNGEPTAAVRAFGRYYYELEFEDAPSDTYEIAFTRKDHDSVMVTVEMPPSYDVTAPAPGGQYPRSLDLPIEWAPAWPGQLMQISIVDDIGSSCIEGLGIGDIVDDDGSHLIAAGSLVGGGSGEDCEVSFSMARSLPAAYPSGLHEGGEVVAYVRRVFTIISTE